MSEPNTLFAVFFPTKKCTPTRQNIRIGGSNIAQDWCFVFSFQKRNSRIQRIIEKIAQLGSFRYNFLGDPAHNIPCSIIYISSHPNLMDVRGQRLWDCSIAFCVFRIEASIGGDPAFNPFFVSVCSVVKNEKRKQI